MESLNAAMSLKNSSGSGTLQVRSRTRVWDLRRDGLRPVSAEDAPKDGTLPAGREVVPGTYMVRIAFDGETASATTEVLADPRSPYSADAQVANAAALDEVQVLQAPLRMGGQKSSQDRRRRCRSYFQPCHHHKRCRGFRAAHGSALRPRQARL